MSEKMILLGDEAVAQGAIHAGITGVYGYPGTPSTEIFEAARQFGRKSGIHAAWSANEKVAYEEALGMSFAGKRALVVMKHVGLNVAADPFMNSAITGVNGGLVLAVADDPGMHSSQNEQDSRFFAAFALIPVLEPGTQQEAYEFTLRAFELSERLNVPIMVRIVTRLAHSRAVVSVGDRIEPQKPLRPERDWKKWTLLPSNARNNYRRLTNAQPLFLLESEKSPANELRTVPNASRAVVTSGVAANYVFENIPRDSKDTSFLIVKQYPVPVGKLRELIASAADILVVEEGYPFIEQQLNGLLGLKGKTVRGKLTGDLPRDGELTPDIVRKALSMEAFEALPAASDVAGRPPQLCSGCPHAHAFEALTEALKAYPDGHVFSDIGCYTLGALPPYSAIETCVDMGASISMCAGASHAGVRPAVCAIGDSTFTHSGMTPLLDAVTENTPMTVLILDNSTVAMTGGQTTLASGDALIRIVRGFGVGEEHVIEIDPLPKNHDRNVEILRRELGYDGLSVVVARRECLEETKRRKKASKAQDLAA